jgi:hypothetical protein
METPGRMAMFRPPRASRAVTAGTE